MQLPLNDLARQVGLKKLSLIDVKIGDIQRKIFYAVVDPFETNTRFVEEKTKPENVWLVYRKFGETLDGRERSGTTEVEGNRLKDTSTGAQACKEDSLENNT